MFQMLLSYTLLSTQVPNAQKRDTLMLPVENSSYETVVFDDDLGAFRVQNQIVLIDCLQLNSDARTITRMESGAAGCSSALFVGGSRSYK
jgi:hypothetical protein